MTHVCIPKLRKPLKFLDESSHIDLRLPVVLSRCYSTKVIPRICPCLYLNATTVIYTIDVGN